MKWVVNIKEVKPYTVVCQWNDDVVRSIDLTEFISKKAENPENSYAQLYDKARFAEVKCDGTTLYWDDGLEFEDYDGKIKKGPLDIAPELLFELTEEGKKLITAPKAAGRQAAKS
jgi:hypothetical protein